MIWNQKTVKVAAAWLTGVMLVIVAACISIAVAKNNNAGAQEPVHEYLKALKAGDGGKAMALLQPPAPNGNASLLDGEPLRESTARLGEFRLNEPKKADDDRMSVDVDYELNGTASRSTFLVEPDGVEWLFFTRWKLVPAALPTVTVSTVNSPEATVNGTQIATPNGSAVLPVFFPASVQASLNNGYFTAEPQNAVVPRSGSDAALTLQTKASSELVAAVKTQVKRYLDGCAAKANKEQKLQPACPFYHSGLERVIPGTINWSIAKYPSVEIEPNSGQWLVAPLNGKARLKAQAMDLFTGVTGPLEEVQNYSFQVRLAFGKDKVTATPVVEY